MCLCGLVSLADIVHSVISVLVSLANFVCDVSADWSFT